MKWFKKRVDYLNNRKVMTLPLEAIGFLDVCMAIAARTNKDGLIGHIEDLTWASRQPDEVVNRCLALLMNAGLLGTTLPLDPDGIDERFYVVGWEDSQSRESVVRQRNRRLDEAVHKVRSDPPPVDASSMSYPEYLKTEWWQHQRQKALEACGRRCQVCNGDGQLDVHHRTYERLGAEAAGDLTVLCRACHYLFHSAGQLAEPQPETGVF